MLNVFVDFTSSTAASPAFNTLPVVYGTTVTLIDGAQRVVCVVPRARKEQVGHSRTKCKCQLCKLLDTSTNGLLAFAVSWNVAGSGDQPIDSGNGDLPSADSHLIYALSMADTSTARTEVFKRTTTTSPSATAVTFVVFNGSLQTASGAHMHCSVIEDGLMIRWGRSVLNRMQHL